MTPTERLLERLDRVRKSGKGWTARCPAHPDKSSSLSVAEGRDGRVLVRCFAGCEAAAVVTAAGLELRDLFPERVEDASPERRTELRELHRQSGWAAALGVLAREAAIVELAAHHVVTGAALPADDLARLRIALERIQGCREVLA